MKREQKGIFYAATAAACYGTNPLFALPLYAGGISVNSVLFYRYAIAVVLYALWIKLVNKTSFSVPQNSVFPMFVLGILFSLSSLLLFIAFKYIDAGVACTILFSYPLFVALIMAAFFKEKITKTVVISLILALTGISFLHKSDINAFFNLKGIGFVLLSSLCYALYIVGVKQIKIIKHIKTNILTFYVMLFGLLVYIFNLKFCTELQILDRPFLWLCTVALAVIPTIISIETISIAIKFIGSTKTALLGCLEPITALFFGITIFHEQLTLKMSIGIILIIIGVSLIIAKKK